MRGAPADDWVHGLSAKHDARVRLRMCRPVGGTPPRLLRLLEVTAPLEREPTIRRALRSPPGGVETAVTAVTPRRLLFRVVGPSTAMCNAVFESGGICTTCPYATAFGPRDTWNVLVSDPPAAQALVHAYASTVGGEATIAGVSACRFPGALTPRQELAIETAHALGFFHQPRRSNLGAVARALGVSRSTANELLRRGLAKVVARREGDGGAWSGST